MSLRGGLFLRVGTDYVDIEQRIQADQLQLAGYVRPPMSQLGFPHST